MVRLIFDMLTAEHSKRSVAHLLLLGADGQLAANLKAQQIWGSMHSKESINWAIVHKIQRFFSYIVGLELKSVLPILQNWVLVSEPPLQFLICSAYITLKEQKTQILHWSLQSEITRRRSIMINLLLLCVKSWSTLIVPCAKFSLLLWYPTASIPSDLAVHQNI